MKLKKEIVERIKGNKALKRRLIEVLKTSRISFWRYLNDNIHEGPLTKAVAVSEISKEFDLPASELFISEVEATVL